MEAPEIIIVRARWNSGRNDPSSVLFDPTAPEVEYIRTDIVDAKLARLQNERNRFRNLLVQVRHETDSVPSNYVEDSVVSTATMCAGTIYDIRAAVEGWE
jgi:hypothetical protein